MTTFGFWAQLASFCIDMRFFHVFGPKRNISRYSFQQLVCHVQCGCELEWLPEPLVDMRHRWGLMSTNHLAGVPKGFSNGAW